MARWRILGFEEVITGDTFTRFLIFQDHSDALTRTERDVDPDDDRRRADGAILPPFLAAGRSGRVITRIRLPPGSRDNNG
ncbi:MAG: hypothetical protein CMM47_01240 [Rhodospirillaceae bacterium]|nr:hypothetical protein [Rhodospirillaceae bacterium]